MRVSKTRKMESKELMGTRESHLAKTYKKRIREVVRKGKKRDS